VTDVVYNTSLACHPQTPTVIASAITVGVRWLADGRLELAYTVAGDCRRLRIPAIRPIVRTDELWKHTCCEMFLACAGDLAYREYNFSPSREWALYAFRGYRDRIAEEPNEWPPEIMTTYSDSVFVLTARVLLPVALSTQALQLGLSTVLENDLGALSYWSLKHPPGKPDFHNRDAFVVTIAPRSRDTLFEDSR
jgi:hypothetical protein